MIGMSGTASKLLPIFFILIAVAMFWSSSADASSDMSVEDIDGRTFVFSSGPGMIDFGDGTITYTKGTISHTFESGVWHPTFTDSSGSSEVTVEVRNDSPIADAIVGSKYRCSMQGMIGAVARSSDGTDSGWLSYDPVTDSAVGTPTKIGEELVTFTFSSGRSWTFHLTIGEDSGETSEGFDIVIASSGLHIRADPTVSLTGRFAEWSVYSLDGSRVAVSSGSVLDVTLSDPGTYCVTVSTTFGTPVLSASGIVTLSDPTEDNPDDKWTAVAIIVAIVAMFFILRRFL